MLPMARQKCSLHQTAIDMCYDVKQGSKLKLYKHAFKLHKKVRGKKS
jgi:hypothetical protein